MPSGLIHLPVTASAPATPVAFQQASAGSATSNGFNPSISRTISTTPTPAPLLAGLALFASYASNGDHGTHYSNWGATAMSQLAYFASGNWAASIFGLLAPPTTAQNVQMGVTGGSNAGREIVGFTAVYENVGSFGPGTGDVLAINTAFPVTSSAGERVVALMAGNGTISGVNQTVRGPNLISGGGAGLRGLWAEAAGASPSVDFLATSGILRIAAARLFPAAA